MSDTAPDQKNITSAHIASKTSGEDHWIIKLLLVSIFSFICGASSFAQPTAERPKDFIKFYKDAISKPPDVEHFVAGVKPLGELPIIRGRRHSGEFSFSAGARAGTNYFMRSLAGSNALVPSASGRIVGQVGTTNYNFLRNTVRYAMGTNLMKQMSLGDFHTTRQFLNMGLADIETSSVIWRDYEFSATNFHGEPRYGVLKISNSLPRLLIISERAASKPLKCIEYFYPTPPDALQGFPTRMVISNMTETGWVPAVENAILELKLAVSPLSNSFFYDSQFKGPNITVTNLFINSTTLVTDKQGRLINLSDPATGISDPPTAKGIPPAERPKLPTEL